MALAILVQTTAVHADGLAEPALASAQAPQAPPDVKAQQAGMAGLAFLHGRWEGTNVSWDAAGKASESASRDVIEPVMDGLLLAVHGMAFPSKAAMGGGAPASQNYGIFSFDDRSRTIRIRAYANGYEQEGSGTLPAPGHAEWRLRSPIGVIRFTAKAHGPDRWIETGEISRDDGKSWVKSFEIDFRRVP